MDNRSTISLCGKLYKILDILSGIVIVDCSVSRKHKIGSGNGERKIYLQGNVEEKYKFFDSFEREIKGFVTKGNLKDYLTSAKKEFCNPTQDYKNKEKLRKEYSELQCYIESLEDVNTFIVKKSDVTHSGLYINNGSGKRIDRNWNLIGDIALPRVSRLAILKLELDGEIIFYFKLSYGVDVLIEDETEEIEVLEKVNNCKISPTEKETIILARVGQGTYRKKLLEESCVCPFTLIDDEHLLIASHIKPWKKSNNNEKKDPKNGFVLSPTYDKLFDRGYISFKDDKSLMISPWLSEYNRQKLGIEEGLIIESLPTIDEKRARYLEYHRQFVLKKLEDL